MLDGSVQVLCDVAATNFWLSMGHNFGCTIASDTLFDSRCVLSDENIAEIECLRVDFMATIFLSIYGGVNWRHLANTTEPSMCGAGDAVLCQVTLTACFSPRRCGHTATDGLSVCLCRP